MDNYFKNSTIGEIVEDVEDAGCTVDDMPHDEYVEHLQEENKKLRQLLWLAHLGVGHACYGDDGEMQCSQCRIDFKRDSVIDIENRIIKINTDNYLKSLQSKEL